MKLYVYSPLQQRKILHLNHMYSAHKSLSSHSFQCYRIDKLPPLKYVWEKEVQILSVFILTLDGGVNLYTDRFIASGEPPSIRCIGELSGPRAFHKAVEKKNV